MFKVLFTLVSAFVLISQPVLAKTNGEAATQIKRIFDLHRYKITVVWDQSDKEHLHQINQDFREQILALKESGVDGQALVDYLKSSFSDQRVKADFENLIKTVKARTLSLPEMVELTKDFHARAGKISGANFMSDSQSGAEIAGYIALMIVLALLSAALVIGGGLNSSGSYDDGYYYDDYGYDDYAW